MALKRFLRESGDKISEEDKTKLNEETEKAKEVYKTASDAETLKTAMENLSKVSNEIFSKLYANQNPGDTNNSGNAGDNNGSTDPNNFSDFTTK